MEGVMDLGTKIKNIRYNSNLSQQEMAKILEMAEETSKKRQVIITTHTPELIKNSNPLSLHYLRMIICFIKVFKFMPQELIDYAGCDGLIGKIIFSLR